MHNLINNELINMLNRLRDQYQFKLAGKIQSVKISAQCTAYAHAEVQN